MSRGRMGCLGLILGSLLGLLAAVTFFLLTSASATSPILAQPVTPPTDVSLFLSEQTLSRFASETLLEPVRLDFEPGGQLQVTAPVELGGLKPVVQVGLTLESQGPAVVSQLHWARVGFFRVPAKWLPPAVVELGPQLGQTITQQIPADFSLVSLTTSSDGLTFHLNYRP